MRYAILALVFIAGCASAEKKANREFIDCVYHAQNDRGMTNAERVDLTHGCYSVYKMRTRQ